MDELQLIFVYNANGDLFSSLTDFAHKIISPATYECQLCKLTYGNFLIKNEWKKFIENLPLKSVFVYRVQFEKQYKVKDDFPSIFVTMNSVPEKIISRNEIENCKTLEELKTLVTQKISLLSNRNT